MYDDTFTSKYGSHFCFLYSKDGKETYNVRGDSTSLYLFNKYNEILGTYARSGDDFTQELFYIMGTNNLSASLPDKDIEEAYVEWHIDNQKDDELLIAYNYNGKDYKVKVVANGVSKDISVDMVKTIVEGALKTEIRKHKLVGLTGDFKYSIKEKIAEKKEKDKMAELSKVAKTDLVFTLVDATTEEINAKKAEFLAAGKYVVSVKTNPCSVKNAGGWADTIATHILYREEEK